MHARIATSTACDPCTFDGSQAKLRAILRLIRSQVVPHAIRTKRHGPQAVLIATRRLIGSQAPPLTIRTNIYGSQASQTAIREFIRSQAQPRAILSKRHGSQALLRAIHRGALHYACVRHVVVISIAGVSLTRPENAYRPPKRMHHDRRPLDCSKLSDA